MARSKIPSLLQKQVFQEAASCCAFCNQAEVAALEIHHIDEQPSNNTLENLLLVCSTCHSKITYGVISEADVRMQKRIIQFQAKGNGIIPDSVTQNVNVAHTHNEGIIANVVNIKGKKTPRMNYPVESIGADTIKKSYIDYLYGKYIEYRKADTSFGAYDHARKFHPGELHRTIQSMFNAKTFFVHVNRFDALVDYIKERIDRTILGRRNTSKGIANYRSFEKFEMEQTGGA